MTSTAFRSGPLVPRAVHHAGAVWLVGSLQFVLALIVLAVAMFQDARWDGLRAYSLFSGVLGLVATVLFLVGTDLGLGPGGMERLIVAPLLLWLIVGGARLLRFPQYAPRGVPAP